MGRIFNAIGALILGAGCTSQSVVEPTSGDSDRPVRPQMSEDIRSQIESVTIIVDQAPPELVLGGDYRGSVAEIRQKGGANDLVSEAIMQAGTPRSEPGTILLLPIILPIALVARSIEDAATGKAHKETEPSREGFDENFTVDKLPSLSGSLAGGLARHLPAEITLRTGSDTADAAVHVSISHINLVFDDDLLTVQTRAYIVVTDNLYEKSLYSRPFYYRESDSLQAWNMESQSRWNDYLNRAREYLSQEIVTALFERVNVSHKLRPRATDSFPGGWTTNGHSSQLTLGWELTLLEGDSSSPVAASTEVFYDLRIYDESNVVYEVLEIKGSSHTVSSPLRDCRTLYWSVRPVYFLADGRRRIGEWMHKVDDRGGLASFGSEASIFDSSDFWRSFASISTPCAP